MLLHLEVTSLIRLRGILIVHQDWHDHMNTRPWLHVHFHFIRATSVQRPQIHWHSSVRLCAVGVPRATCSRSLVCWSWRGTAVLYSGLEIAAWSVLLRNFQNSSIGVRSNDRMKFERKSNEFRGRSAQFMDIKLIYSVLNPPV
jgi:hypothetical protein